MYEQDIAPAHDRYASAAADRIAVEACSLEAPAPQEDCANWFEHDSIARYVLDHQGNILRANGAARLLTAAGVLGSGGVFICPSHRNRAEFDVLIARLADDRQTNGRMLFRAGDDAWCLLDLATLPGLSGRVFATARPARSISAEAIEPLRAVFGLTRAETSVLSHLTCGEAPKDIGRKMDMSIHTVRAHLRAICMRMGVKGINGALRLSFQLAN
ncbi:hypothetical protein AS593_07030 [Caulobacter vibrioides]|nr:hypothetical protein AS593_07030 [Caulobacter vibrioides]